MTSCFYLVLTAFITAGAAFVGLFPLSLSASDDILARSRAMYASLKSYADIGTVTQEFGTAASPTRERHTFRTLYRAPRHYFFDFTKGEKPGGARIVVWGDGDAFHSWWSVTGIENTYPRGTGRTAFTSSTYNTVGSVAMIAPLLFQGAGIVGTLEEFGSAAVESTEIVAGQNCHKLVGIAKSRYVSGHETNVRRTTVWIDAKTLFVRKVFEDTPRGMVAGTVSRITTTFEPQANPTLDDSRFRFTVPSTQ